MAMDMKLCHSGNIIIHSFDHYCIKYPMYCFVIVFTNKVVCKVILCVFSPSAVAFLNARITREI